MNRYIVGTDDVRSGIEADGVEIELTGLLFYSANNNREAAFAFAPHAWRTCCRMQEGEDWPEGLAQIISTESGVIK